jgi:hypothetical protein
MAIAMQGTCQKKSLQDSYLCKQRAKNLSSGWHDLHNAKTMPDHDRRPKGQNPLARFMPKVLLKKSEPT